MLYLKLGEKAKKFLQAEHWSYTNPPQSPITSGLRITPFAAQQLPGVKKSMWKGNPRLQCSSVLIHFRNQSNIQPFSEFSVGFAHTKINCYSPTNCNKVVPYLSLATTTFSLTTKPPQPLPLTAAHLLFDQILFLVFTSPLSLTYPLHPYSVFNLTAKCFYHSKSLYNTHCSWPRIHHTLLIQVLCQHLSLN